MTGITKSDRPPLFPKLCFPLVCPMFPGDAMCLNEFGLSGADSLNEQEGQGRERNDGKKGNGSGSTEGEARIGRGGQA